jgi:hypothetical protein
MALAKLATVCAFAWALLRLTSSQAGSSNLKPEVGPIVGPKKTLQEISIYFSMLLEILEDTPSATSRVMVVLGVCMGRGID